MRQGLVILLITSLLVALCGPGLWLHQQFDHQHHHYHQPNDAGLVHHHDHAAKQGCAHHGHGHAVATSDRHSSNRDSSTTPMPMQSHDDCSVCHLLLTVQASALVSSTTAVWLHVVSKRFVLLDATSAHLTWVGFVSGRDPPSIHF